MKNAIQICAYALLVVGTAGLLLNEFWFDWGRAAVLAFASANLVGLLALVMNNWIVKISEGKK